MRAIVADQPGDPDVLHVTEVPDPVPAPGEVLLRVRATALNRADLAQRRGFYPPPPGITDIIGMEAAGEIESVTEGVSGWAVGDRACCILAGGGYAEKVAVPAGQLMQVPANIDIISAGGIPQGFFPAHANMVTRCRLRGRENTLIPPGSHR